MLRFALSYRSQRYGTFCLAFLLVFLTASGQFASMLPIPQQNVPAAQAQDIVESQNTDCGGSESCCSESESTEEAVHGISTSNSAGCDCEDECRDCSCIECCNPLPVGAAAPTVPSQTISVITPFPSPSAVSILNSETAALFQPPRT